MKKFSRLGRAGALLLTVLCVLAAPIDVRGTGNAVYAAEFSSFPYLSAGTKEIDIGLRTTFTTGYSIIRGVGNVDDIKTAATYSIDDPSVALVDSNGAVYSVAPGETVLRVSYEGLTLDIPVTVSEKVRWKTDPPTSPQSTLDVYAGVDRTRLETHRNASLSLLNSLRGAVNVPLFKLDESLNKAAQAHANYTTVHKSMTHIEGKDKEGFSGAMPSMRAEAFGYPNISVAETIAPTFDEPVKATQMLIDAPLHRITLLSPSVDEVGIGVADGYTVINPGTKKFGETMKDRDIVYYPYNGQKDIPTFWLANESPNPLAYYNQQGARVGYPISISTSYGNKLIHKSAAITEASGKAVDYYLVNADTKGSDEAILLIPKQPLQGNTTYTVSVSFSETNSFYEEKGIPAVEFTKSWSFTTGADDQAANRSSDRADSSTERKAGTGAEAEAEAPVQEPKESALPSFSDVRSHWARDTIEWGYQLGIVNGYEDGTFKPNTLVSEAEFLAMLFPLYPDTTSQIEEDGTVQGVWSLGLWSDKYYRYATALHLGLKESAANAKSRNAPITRAEVAQMIAGLNGKNYANDDDAIRFLLDAGYSTGKKAPTVEGYAGQDRLTRAEALQFLRNLKLQGMDAIQSRPDTAAPYVKAE
ncbi:hypothetical protein PAE9249_02268 [Paenibacillus sp. CECT 9249]|uniref:CAP and S-layer homology domain-containing protein n=1 Tax=Paenibacillus sp. CECT 9249 TaxID=2845385 RepID=UPI001E4E141C|nr:S-layer homology domain-containing protein [Paenibacillus sp. CECT 9249]CAH0119760.1 hypothetical protein PAE9249_02268 [Paenibacillus sp. CECT 9249]